ncbi:DinB family protein [Gramella lutea]|uniref:DinB family protein n=1 Tax=Christiangramia lutea TaxID=1607951 RepID=A0A9X1V295_9FLAO|nr:DinB family protein [Christiangramia lutea]MCH4823087.1 DinB family protein [Christiangramia lutea]
MKILVSFLVLAFFSSEYELKPNCGSFTVENEVRTENATNKTDAFKYLKETRKSLEKSVKGLSEEQMTFKPEDGGWSVAEIVEHIIIVEGALKGMLEGKIKSGENLDQKAEVKMTDDQVVSLITDRSSSIQTQDQFQPTGKFSGSEEAINAFDTQRESIVSWLKDSDADMRNYVNEFPFGKIDAYQTVLFMAGHTERHTAQIKEIKSAPNFPG